MNQTKRDIVWSTLLSIEGEVRLDELAKACNVSKNTASEVMHVAAQDNLVDYEKFNPLTVRVVQ